MKFVEFPCSPQDFETIRRFLWMLDMLVFLIALRTLESFGFFPWVFSCANVGSEAGHWHETVYCTSSSLLKPRDVWAGESQHGPRSEVKADEKLPDVEGKIPSQAARISDVVVGQVQFPARQVVQACLRLSMEFSDQFLGPGTRPRGRSRTSQYN